MTAFFDALLTLFIVMGLFFMAYTAYRQQSLLETVREIKEIFEERAEEAREVLAYK